MSIIRRFVGLAILSGIAAQAFAQQETSRSEAEATADGSQEVVGQIIIRGARTSTATKMDAPLLSVPQNIQVLSSKFIEDIGADLLEDALRHVAGVAVGGYYNGWDYFRIRGFDGI